jgi:hypothetical protein
MPRARIARNKQNNVPPLITSRTSSRDVATLRQEQETQLNAGRPKRQKANLPARCFGDLQAQGAEKKRKQLFQVAEQYSTMVTPPPQLQGRKKKSGRIVNISTTRWGKIATAVAILNPYKPSRAIGGPRGSPTSDHYLAKKSLLFSCSPPISHTMQPHRNKD